MEALESVNPISGDTIGYVNTTPLQSTTLMYEQARRAFQTWQNTSIKERLQYIRKLRHIIVEQLEDGIDIIHQDTGKPKVESITADLYTILDAIAYLEKHAEKILKTRKTKTPIAFIGKKSYTSYHPRGVVLVISPWNYPFQLAMNPVINAVIAGNCAILKPSEVTPLVGQWMESLFEQAGFPDHVIQVAHGGKEIGAKLVSEKPDYIFFTGSDRTGKIILQEAAKNLIPTSLELGGKDPMIVFKDAHIERAVNGALWGSLTNYGQVCMSVERIYVEKKIYEPFVVSLKRGLQNLKTELSDDADLGSMTFEQQLQVVQNHVSSAISKGATLYSGSHPKLNQNQGMKIEPIILTGVNHKMEVIQEETFGPVINVIPFENEEEAIKLANNSRYGLSSSVWSKDINKAKRVAGKLAAGSVLVNDVLVAIANPHLPFGGIKDSGIGRYHAAVGVTNFCHQKSIMVDSGFKKAEVNWYPYAGKLPPFIDFVNSWYGKRKKPIKMFSSYIQLLRKSK
ncbi:aldehyde dehydrogenase family protein [Chengkuizengella axinellae]|uniref:Aldehyde dehydrogenase n=1 Tax=Chengkuizengella axinellae TaxID=3064388 RepID=A0ABT9IV90_9BACL|nr:aldehyde dehydrogenase family protein [Chengkuizengella sp. 2205SS18-9]MDP5273281.1 aldehyde dehydrogenase family protein [Chengkuizengella sp. 2205SS18-9]